MTDRAHSLTIALERDTQDDDLESLMAAIRQLRGVAGVEMNVADAAAYTYEYRADMRMQGLFMAILSAIQKGGLAKATKALEAVEPRPVL